MVVIGNYRATADLRKSPRQQITHRGSILVKRGATPITCKLSDVSQSGARIVLDTEEEIPELFMLLLSTRGQVWRRCRLVWQSGKEMGVEFLRGADAQDWIKRTRQAGA